MDATGEMASKKRKTKENNSDTGSFSRKEDEVPGSSCSTPRETPEVPQKEIIKKENEEKEEMLEKMDKPQEKHLHHFKVMFNEAGESHNVTCQKRCTVLEAIKSHLPDEFSKMTHRADENIVIQLGLDDKKYTVATHFPCCLVDEGEFLIVSSKSEEVEVIQEQQVRTFQPKDSYSVFYIDTVGGENTKTKKIFQSNAVKIFKFLCVYGEKGMTVKEALERDGRFCDLGNFKLSENKNEMSKFDCKTLVDDVHQHEFKICLPLRQDGKKTGKNQVKENEQFLKLKEWMESRFPGRSFKETLKLKQENFEKIQHSFSEVHTVRELVNLSESICLLKIKETNSQETMQGTGFVLVDTLILTSAHLFKPWQKIQNWWEYLNITAEFNFENPDGKSKKTFQAKVILGSHYLDFALLELIQSPDQTETEKIPPGLLKKFGPVPGADGDGGACIIGHPAGGVKKMDVTCVIRKENREQAVSQNLHPYKDYLFTICSVNEQIRTGPCADNRVTYNTFMYHGSGGSPMFDASGRVFGLHSGGFFFDKVIPGHSVIEYCYPLLDVFKKLLEELQKNGRSDVLVRFQKESQGNRHLEEIIESAGLKQNTDQERKDKTG